MLSFLSSRALLLKQEFVKRHPHAWLLWEPGGWNPPAKEAHHKATLVPAAMRPIQPAAGDSLCFELKLRLGKTSVRIGRDPACDIVLNDATVSREHLLLSNEAGQWLALPGGASVTIARRSAAITARLPLASGQMIGLGSVQLTFYDPQGLLTRLSLEQSRLRKG